MLVIFQQTKRVCYECIYCSQNKFSQTFGSSSESKVLQMPSMTALFALPFPYAWKVFLRLHSPIPFSLKSLIWINHWAKTRKNITCFSPSSPWLPKSNKIGGLSHHIHWSHFSYVHMYIYIFFLDETNFFFFFPSTHWSLRGRQASKSSFSVQTIESL